MEQKIKHSKVGTAPWKIRAGLVLGCLCLAIAILPAGCRREIVDDPVLIRIRAHVPDEPTSTALGEDWEEVSAGLHGSFASIDKRHDRDKPPEVDGAMTWSAVAWRGERLSAQIVLWTSDGAEQLRISLEPLRSKEGKQLAASCIRPSFVRYVIADDGSPGCSPPKPTTPKILTADVLDTVRHSDISAQSTRPVWLTIDVPADVAAGQYSGTINVTAQGGKSLSFEINVEVLAITLPPPAEWPFHLDLWQNPYAVARYHNVEPFSSKHMKLLEPYLRMLAGAGQKCITTSIVPKPWGGQTYDPFDSMIRWVRNADGSWYFDYTVFDKYVEFCQRCGITEQINCYSMVPWTNRFGYLDLVAGYDHKFVEAKAGTDAYENHWRLFLIDFVKHLRRRGWLEKTTIAMDERPLEAMQKVIAFVKETAPELKITLAGKYHPEIKFDIYDLCVFIDPTIDRALIDERTERSLPMTFYTCCSPKRPNTFPCSPSAESTWMGWHAAAQGYNGYLRWAYNSWVPDPLYDTSYIKWNAGDCFLVYPGPRSSIRFERLREGIADYEKIRIIRQMLTESDTAETKKSLKQLDKMLAKFTYESAQNNPCAVLVNQGKKLLTDLSRDAVSKK